MPPRSPAEDGVGFGRTVLDRGVPRPGAGLPAPTIPASSAMKRLLPLAFFAVLAAVSSAQGLDPGHGVRPGDVRRNAPPVTNPEPMTLVALAGGAAVAGGLLRRRKQAK